MTVRSEVEAGGASSQDRLVSEFGRMGDAVVVCLTGELDFYTSRHLNHKLDAVKKAGVREIVFDIRDLAYLDSTGIGVLVGCFRDLTSAGGRMACTVPRSSFLRKILEKTKIASLLPFAETVEAAIELLHPEDQACGEQPDHPE